MFNKFRQIRKWQLYSLVLLSLLALSVPYLKTLQAKALSTNDTKQGQQPMGAQLTLDMPDWWNAPAAISKVWLKDQEILPGSPIEATADWARDLRVEVTSKSEKPISYISYAIDFTIEGEKSIYRLQLTDSLFSSVLSESRPLPRRPLLKGQT